MVDHGHDFRYHGKSINIQTSALNIWTRGDIDTSSLTLSHFLFTCSNLHRPETAQLLLLASLLLVE
jgi:hypothetical protein